MRNRRVRALIDKDYQSLREMLDESLVHVHTTGRTENYASFLAGVSTNLEFLAIRHGTLDVRLFGNTAVMIGPLDQRIRIKADGSEMDLAAIAIQVGFTPAVAGNWRAITPAGAVERAAMALRHIT